MRTATRRAAPKPPILPFPVPAPIDKALKTAVGKMDDVASDAKHAAARLEKKVRSAAENVRKSGEELANDPKAFLDTVVRDSRAFSKTFGKNVEKVKADVSKEAGRLADDVVRRVAETVETVVETTLHRFNLPTRDEVKTLTSKVDALGRKVDALTGSRPRRRR